MPERNGATEANSVRNKMKTLNRPKRSKPPLAVSTVKTVAPTTPPQPPTSESVSLARHARVIERGTQRIGQQRKTRLELKAQTKTPPLAIAPRPPAGTSIQPFTRKLATIAPTEAAEPKLTSAAIRALGFALAAMERTDRTPNQRRLMAFHHLRQHSALSNINPDDLISEQAKTDSCSTQKAARPIE
jgi:hypothetical protein